MCASKNNTVTLVEVSPRDGLQNETVIVSTKDKLTFIQLLIEAGLSMIEVTSFVSKHKIPQLGDANLLASQLPIATDVTYDALVPNLYGFKQFSQHKLLNRLCVFSAPSDAFCLANIDCTTLEAQQRISSVIDCALTNNYPVRAYISCAWHCPYQGKIAIKDTLNIVSSLYNMGCSEIVLADTTGSASTSDIHDLLDSIFSIVPNTSIAIHLHDTQGLAENNLVQALDLGIRIIDCSVTGLGGCPYAPNSAGNIATETVLDVCSKYGLSSNINREKLNKAGQFIRHVLANKQN